MDKQIEEALQEAHLELTQWHQEEHSYCPGGCHLLKTIKKIEDIFILNKIEPKFCDFMVRKVMERPVFSKKDTNKFAIDGRLFYIEHEDRHSGTPWVGWFETEESCQYLNKNPEELLLEACAPASVSDQIN